MKQHTQAHSLNWNGMNTQTFCSLRRRTNCTFCTFARSALTHTHTRFLSTVLIVVRGSMFTVWCVKYVDIYFLQRAEQQPKLGYLFKFCVHFVPVWSSLQRLSFEIIIQIANERCVSYVPHTFDHRISHTSIVEQTENMSKLKIWIFSRRKWKLHHKIEFNCVKYFFSNRKTAVLSFLFSFFSLFSFFFSKYLQFTKSARNMWFEITFRCCVVAVCEREFFAFDPTNEWLKTPIYWISILFDFNWSQCVTETKYCLSQLCLMRAHPPTHTHTRTRRKSVCFVFDLIAKTDWVIMARMQESAHTCSHNVPCAAHRAVRYLFSVRVSSSFF